MANFIRYRNLPKSPAPGVCLHCDGCQESYSAYSGDYFLANPNDVVECTMCDEPLKLVRKVVTYADARGYTVVELLICIAGVGVLALTVAVIFAAFHFLAKVW